MYANEFETKEKQKLAKVKKFTATYTTPVVNCKKKKHFI